MYKITVIVLFGCFLQTQLSNAIWTCTEDTECASLSDSICRSGECVCPAGKQPVLGGTVCFDIAPYHTSPCLEDFQCSRLFTTFTCRPSSNQEGGNCFCQSGNHYFLGRCWSTRDYAEACTRDEECLSVLTDPFSLKCDGTCGCADGYYSRQRGECRRKALAVGDGCVLDEDCQFEGGACDFPTLQCYNSNSVLNTKKTAQKNITIAAKTSTTLRQHGAECNANTPCPDGFLCSSLGALGACICPTGYYAGGDRACYAELGSPSTEDQCIGLFAQVLNGICTCPPNFLFEENMRDCIKATIRITDSCVTDANCFTFGAAARCGPPQEEAWGIRNCECDTELAVWDADRNMCRLFAGIGESCEVDSDCLAGELEIQCEKNEDGEGFCACPEGYVASEGLCLTTGLDLGDACQASQECTETENTVCENGVCSCGNGYREDDGVCAPIIGGTCQEDSDCIIENSLCVNISNVFTCQCNESFVAYDDECWPVAEGYQSFCNVTAQCTEVLGANSECQAEECVCSSSHHYRDGFCWRITELFEPCTRSSECFLTEISERAVCRNSICQCDFDFPYLEEERTCSSSAATVTGSLLLLFTALMKFASS